MVLCHSCHHSTVIDHGQITYYSHQDRSKRDQLIEDIFQHVSEESTADKLGVIQYMVWHMRMKLLHALEKLVANNTVNDEVEMDEKYILTSHKGKKQE